MDYIRKAVLQENVMQIYILRMIMSQVNMIKFLLQGKKVGAAKYPAGKI